MRSLKCLGDEQQSQVEGPVPFDFVDLNLFRRRLNVTVESVSSPLLVKLIG